ncbi:MAG: hypothetical protein HQM16_15670 [Deltaproteobacteria bacterium]|nr:hypothetical protein [Deltaproteobacteria bacterium]
MKKTYTMIILCLALALSVIQIHPAKAGGFSKKGVKTIGLNVTGFYDINSGFESLYVSFPTQDIKAAGLGAALFFEYGIADKFTTEIDLGYSRLTYANKFKNVIKENFFVGDILGRFYFLNNQRIQPALIFGAGAIVSSAVAPTFDVGFGSHFMITDSFSLKAEVLYKTAIIFHRGEGRVGFAYHF